MQGSNKDASEAKEGRTRVKPKILKESALAAGLAAFEALESAENAARPVQATARTLVEQGIESILRSRDKGVPLLRIYNDARKAAGLRISYQTFAGYVSEISREKGLRPAKTKEETGAPPRSEPDAVPASPTVEAPAGNWKCTKCPEAEDRHEFRRQPGTYYRRCEACGEAYYEVDGKISDKRVTAGSPA